MNTNSQNDPFEGVDPLKVLSDILSFKSEEEKFEFEKEMMSLDIMHLIQNMMEELDLSKSKLAKGVGHSKSFITQLFTADKLINIDFLVRVQRACNVKFAFDYTPNYQVTPIHSMEDYRRKYTSSTHLLPNTKECVMLPIDPENKELVA